MKTANRITGWMVIALVATGLFSLLAALLAIFNEYDYIGAGLCLLASALAFGGVLKAYSKI